MTRHELLVVIADRARVTQEKAAEILRVAVEAIADRIHAGEEVPLADLGKFYPKRHKQRCVTAPPGAANAGERMTLPAQVTVGFRAAKSQRKKVSARRGT